MDRPGCTHARCLLYLISHPSPPVPPRGAFFINSVSRPHRRLFKRFLVLSVWKELFNCYRLYKSFRRQCSGLEPTRWPFSCFTRHDIVSRHPMVIPPFHNLLCSVLGAIVSLRFYLVWCFIIDFRSSLNRLFCSLPLGYVPHWLFLL